MPDLTDLLEHLAPEPAAVAPPVVDELWRRGRGRRRRNQLLRVTALLAVIGLGAAALAARDGASLRPADSSPAASEPTASDPTVVVPMPTYVDTVGTAHTLSWQQLAAPDFDLAGYSTAGTLPDGRLVLWNGTEATESVETPRDVTLAFLDPATESWSRSAPFPGTQLFGNDAEVSSGGNIVVHQYDSGAQVADRFAVYDVTNDSWTTSPPMVTGDVAIGWAFDGTTLAALTRPAAEYVSEMKVRRWVVGSDVWADGATPPLGSRGWPGVAHALSSLVVYGGLTETTGPDTVDFPQSGEGAPNMGIDNPPAFAALDGARYDTLADTWTHIPRSPLAGASAPVITFAGSGLLVTSGLLAAMTDGSSLQVAAYDPAVGWQLLVPDSVTRAGGVQIDQQSLVASTTDSWLTLDMPYDTWRSFPGGDPQRNWEPVALGVGRYLQPRLTADGSVQYVYVDNSVVSPAPAVPFTNVTEARASVVASSAGPLLIAPDLTIWLLQVHAP